MEGSKVLKKVEGKRKSVFREYAEAIIIALILALVIRTFVVQAFKIPSGSMEPTLQIGDHILVNKFIYGLRIPFTSIRLLSFREPERGDVIVFIYPVDPSKDFIKRVVATGGETVRFSDKKLFINLQRRDNFGPVTVPEGQLFVMGDNRDRSLDSRFWGFVPIRDVLGKAFIIYWSWDSQDSTVRWSRFGHLIH
jgi:signal peptidase I